MSEESESEPLESGSRESGPLDSGAIAWEEASANRDPNFPRVRDFVRSARIADSHRVGILGVPFDGAVPSSRKGAREGPSAVRKALAGLAADDGRDGLPPLDIGDYGNVRCNNNNVQRTHERCYQAARAVADACAFPFFIGGDHSLTYPCFRALSEKHGPLGVIVFDAHHDVRSYTADHISSGTPFRRCLELGDAHLAGKNLVQIGIQPFANSRAYADYCREQGVTVFDMDHIESQGMTTVTAEAVRIASQGTGGVYLSIDIDAVDAAYAPGSSAARPGGLTARELLGSITTIAATAPRLVAADLMELAPPLDPSGRTAMLGALLFATLCTEVHRLMGR